MNIFWKRKFIKLFTWMIILGVTAGDVLPVHAAEVTSATEETTVIYIYHQHIGDGTEEGGCYKQPIYHCHTGDEQTGGVCYETPVYHSHNGNETEGGSCYENIIYHVHEGDGTQEGGCYVANYNYHTHDGECYKQVIDDEFGCYVVDWWDTTEDDYEGHDYKYYEMSCGQTIHGTNSVHYHSVLNCNKGRELAGYVLGCNKTGESVEAYTLSCEKSTEDIDGYHLSCSRTSEDIDGYDRSCGKDEETAYGEIIITKQLIATEGATAFAEVKDYTGGEIQFSETPFWWYDGQGNVIGTGNSISIAENDTYQVRVDVVNEDINKDSLWAEITVDNIRHAEALEPDNGAEGTEDIEDTEQKADEEQDTDEEQGADTEQTDIVSEPQQAAIVIPTATPTATPMPVLIPKEDEGATKAETPYEPAAVQTDEEAAYRQEMKEPVKETELPSPTLKKEIQIVKSEEKKSEMMPIEQPQTLQKASFFETPAVKLLMITAGTFAVLTGIFVLFYLLRRSVKIFNDDGQGRLIYLGRTMVQFADDGYLVTISSQMVEAAYTNRYCIKPGVFRIGRGSEEEILVEKQEKRISVPLQKEMIVVI